MSEEVAIIVKADFGVRDSDTAMLWWDAELLNGGAVLHCFWGQDALDRINDAQCYSVSDLNGKPIIVERDGNAAIFVRFWKVKR